VNETRLGGGATPAVGAIFFPGELENRKPDRRPERIGVIHPASSDDVTPA